jgi:hypothetical protein
MPYKKGESGNPQGRPKGAPNKATKDLRKAISDFLEGRFDEVVKTWEGLSGREKVAFYRDLLQYAVPKLQSTELKTDFDKMTDEQLDRIIEELKRKVREQISEN